MPSLTIRHVTLYRYRQPVAFGEHRMMRRPRDSHDQRVLEASLEISPEPRSLRFVQDAFGNHVGIARTPQGTFRSTIAPTRCRTRLLHRTPSTRSGERGWPLGSSIPARQWVD